MCCRSGPDALGDSLSPGQLAGLHSLLSSTLEAVGLDPGDIDACEGMLEIYWMQVCLSQGFGTY